MSWLAVPFSNSDTRSSLKQIFEVSGIPNLVILDGNGAKVAVLCITKYGEVLNYQAFTDGRGIFRVAETMSETNRWESYLARTISSFHEHCNRVGMPKPGRRFKYNLPSGYSHTVKPFLYQPAIAPLYCS